MSCIMSNESKFFAAVKYSDKIRLKIQRAFDKKVASDSNVGWRSIGTSRPSGRTIERKYMIVRRVIVKHTTFQMVVILE